MLARELRQAYIEFFKMKDHIQVPGAPLTPRDVLGRADSSTLFTSAGMQQFKPYFSGEATPPHPRICTVQKCLRTGDIDSVGDLSHCTFFEMLGNFSFGDYFKPEVIPWTWEFLTQRLNIDGDRLSVTVYLDDDEAFDIWHTVVGLPADRIHRLGEDKNYWPANAITEGPNGPCGPCSEVYYRVAAEDAMCADPSLTPTQRFLVDDEAGRWLEIWNNVFTQFNRDEDDQGRPILHPLPQRNNDTGAGLDRIICVVQGVDSVFESDLFLPILKTVEELSGHKYHGSMSPTDLAFRVIAEHTRSATFCIADGILPERTGREYVLRRLLRRAVRYGKTALGFSEPFIYQVADKVIEQMGGFYPELEERSDLIRSTIRLEEERFLRTLDIGLERLRELLLSPDVAESKILSGKDAFLLYDTFGFPLEVTEEIAAESAIEVDRAGYEIALEEQRTRSRPAGEAREVFRELGAAVGELQRSVPPTDFLGYVESTAAAEVKGLTVGGSLVDSARAGDTLELVLNRTPFYAESGGQVGDSGWITASAGDTMCAVRIQIDDTQKVGGLFLHKGRILEGEIFTGQAVTAAVDLERRAHIMRNHTATHLLHAALRQILGTHVHQKGSLVAPDRLRFDFTHSSPLSPDELRQVEDLVNEQILMDTAVTVHANVPLAEAKARGAMALFGEKYGDSVRMIEIPGFSVELCGGTHLRHTSQIGLFKITSESGVAAGVRRVEAVTGAGAYQLVRQREDTLSQLAQAMKANPKELTVAVERLLTQRAQLEKQVQRLRTGAGASAADSKEHSISGILLITGTLAEGDSEALANLADKTANQRGSAVVVMGAAIGDKVTFVAKATPDLVKRGIHAGNLVRDIARITGGGGGGRPDFAQAGGRDPDKLLEALAAAPAILEQQAAQNK